VTGGKYASTTTVPVEKSRGDLERVLARWGASSFGYGWTAGRAQIAFVHEGRRVRFDLPLPDETDPTFTTYRRGQWGDVQQRSPEAAYRLWEQACRQRWRALLLVVKAKLEAVEVGISTFEDEFLAHVVLPDGSTVGEAIRPQIAEAYRTGVMPPLLAITEGT
jgi:hypothetical protein